MFYYGVFLTKEQEEGALVKRLFSEKNEELLLLLSKYEKNSDYDTIRDGIFELIYRQPEYQKQKSARVAATYPPKTVLEAIELLHKDGSLSSPDAQLL